ncbi:MAG: DNA polymerase III subunit delta [Alphaproteobacteria bacterium]|nr:DNA polymerase III subunit delta [Alphaproteobacteria bacterium]
MKLTAAQISGFLQNPPPSVRVILIYGPDAGLISERAEALAIKLVKDKNDPFAVSQLTGAMVNDDPSRLYDEAAAMTLGGGRRLIRVQSAVDGNAAALTRFVSDPPQCDSLILMEGGDLDKRSKLRAACEGASPLTAGIPCYAEDSAARQRTIAAMLQADKLVASRDVIRLLADILPPDRLALRSEVDKLALYAKGQTEVSLEDVRAVIADAGGAEIDDLVQAAASGDPKRTATLLDHLLAEQTSPVALLRGMQRHLMRLQLARAHMAHSMGAGEALKKLAPPVFWKLVEPMTKQLSRWSLERLELRLAQLAEAEAACKRTGTPDTALVSQIFLSMAVRA